MSNVNPAWDLKKVKKSLQGLSGWTLAFGAFGSAGEVLIKGVDTTFILKLKDGRCFLATTGQKAFKKMEDGMNVPKT